MIKIKDAFQNGKAFIPFLTCGDPDLETTEALVKAMAAAGADLIELGIPFSDPTAEGPVIQGANLRALNAGTTTDKVFDLVKRLRQSVAIPMVFMTYANVVFSYGSERFLKNAAEAGVQGLILPDVPYEEKADFEPLCEKYGLELVSMIAPTSHDRIKMIASEAKGFLYCVSSLGVTGVRSSITTDIGGMVELVRQVSDTPAAVGFGISTPEQAKNPVAPPSSRPTPSACGTITTGSSWSAATTRASTRGSSTSVWTRRSLWVTLSSPAVRSPPWRWQTRCAALSPACSAPRSAMRTRAIGTVCWSFPSTPARRCGMTAPYRRSCCPATMPMWRSGAESSP